MIIIKNYDYGSVSGIDNDDSVVSGIGNSGDATDANFLAFIFTLTTFR